jgi:NAD(P)-dependent dehydrogenase (short-subunit alcohol dehydrogenase family)
MSGKVAVVTGATGGIGKEIARGLARLGAHVVIGARDPRRGEATRAELAVDAADAAAPPSAGGADGANDGDGTGPGTITVLSIDVADQTSIHAFASAFSERFKRLDVLVNNAGAWFTDRRESPDGIELTLATNVLGPHLLTQLLLDPLQAAKSARVVNVVSSITGSYDPTDLQFIKRGYNGYEAYAQSKEALTMLTWGLASRLQGTGVCANTAEPGFVRTGFNDNARGPRATMINIMAKMFAVSAAKGADTPLWVASAPELEGVTGKSFAGRKERPAKFTEPGPIVELERLCGDLDGAMD